MAANTGQLEQDIRRLRTAMQELDKATGGAATQWNIFNAVLDRLTKSSTNVARLNTIKATFQQFEKQLRMVGESAKFSEQQINRMINAASKLASTPVGQKGMMRLGFRGGAGGRGEDIGQDRTVGSYLTDPTSREYQKFVGGLGEGGTRQINTARTALGKMEMGLKNITDVTQDTSRGITRFTAQVGGAGLPLRRATVTVNQLGQQLKSTQRHLRTFGGAIVRDIVEVAKWTVAIAIVYAPLRRLQQTMQEMVQVEAKLADVQVALGASTSSLNLVWEESATVARELGVSVEGVIDGYVLAVRATANIREPGQKAAATVAVLKDSMVLAKLAGIDQAIAMDTLVGALRQLNMPLTEGSDLIDKWVAVSKAANVSLHTLAESFAITSTAAENVGIDMDHLNGIIAAVAEVTTLSATESGNAVRAFISGFQRDQSGRELAKFGIAVSSVTGELRSFTDVIEDIVERREIGLISDAELAKISEVIGGGARRGPQVNAFLSNYGRVQELAAISSEANGDAAEALAIKMDTLETATQNLNNAFTELSKSLGSDGGFLDIAKGGVRGLTAVIDFFTNLTSVIGKATPAIIALTAAYFILSRAMRADAGGRIATMLGTPIGATRLGRLPGMGGARGFSTFGEAGSRAFGAFGGAAGGAGIGIAAALPTLLQKDKGAEEYGKVGASIAGGIAGTLIAGPIGGIIGATIGQAFINELEVDVTSIQSTMTKVIAGAFKAATTSGDFKLLDPEQIDAETKALIDQAQVTSTGAPMWLQQIVGGTGFGRGFETPIEEMLGARPGTVNETAQRDILERALVGALAGEEREIGEPTWGSRDIIAEFEEIGANDPEVRALARMIVEAIDEGITNEASKQPIDISAFTKMVAGTSAEFGGISADIVSARRDQILQEVAAGETGIRALTEFQNIGDFEQVVSTIASSLGKAGDSASEYEDIANTLINATEQEREIFNQLAGELGELINVRDELADSTEDYGTRQEYANTQSKIANKEAQLAQMLDVSKQGRLAREYKLPSLIGVTPEATTAQLRQAVSQARDLSEDMLDSLELEPAERQKVISGWGELAFQNVETFRIIMQDITGINKDILDKILDDMGLAASEASQLGIITPDIGSEQAPQLRGNIAFFESIIEQLRPLDRQDQGVIYKDYVTDVLHADGLAVQLALQTLIDVNEQQLEGIFNIPDGITAAIPFTGRLYFSDQPIPEASDLGAMLKALAPAMDQLPAEVENAASQAHADALSTIEVLNAMLAAGQGSPEFLDKMEQVVRDLGGIPEKRPDIPEAVDEPYIPPPLSDEAVERMKKAALEMGYNTFGGLAEYQQSLVSQGYAQNPELRQHHQFAGFSAEDILNALPQSIPVTINTRIINPVTVVVDGLVVQKAIEERQYEDLESATRLTGATGYIME